MKLKTVTFEDITEFKRIKQSVVRWAFVRDFFYRPISRRTQRYKMMALFLLMTGGLLGLLVLVSYWSILFHLNEKKIKVDFGKPNWRFFEYMRCYKQMTLKETGHVGVLFYLLIVSCSLSLMWFLVVVISLILNNYK